MIESPVLGKYDPDVKVVVEVVQVDRLSLVSK